MKYYVVDAFTEEVFGGNPAGVCVLDKTLSSEQMQKIAAENNLSETAFVQKRAEGGYHLRWFTPVAEIDLCGHATLGTAYVISRFIEPNIKEIEFYTISGILTVECNGELLEMDFPSRMPVKRTELEEFKEILGVVPMEVWLSRDWIIELESEQVVQELTPDFTKMSELEEGLGVVVTAKGTTTDFVSRYFCPELGVKEDPVTGSSHSSLIPYWSEKLGKKEMISKQCSERGGFLYCVDKGERVQISGKATLYLEGEILAFSEQEKRYE